MKLDAGDIISRILVTAFCLFAATVIIRACFETPSLAVYLSAWILIGALLKG